eukprot:Hpha_TRINITY_DN11277_c0_g2::TRINITY_DN11277_c0_g2_i1::g.167664::m.167664
MALFAFVSIGAISGGAACDISGLDWTAHNSLRGNEPRAAADPEECRGMCSVTEGCRWFSHDAALGVCHLKGDILKQAPDNFWPLAPFFPGPPQPAPGVVSGPRECDAAREWIEDDVREELLALASCSSHRMKQLRRNVKRCRAGREDARFHHWQVHHPSATHRRTYPLSEW